MPVVVEPKVGEDGLLSAGFLLSVVSFFQKSKRTFPAVIEWILSWLTALGLAAYLGYCYVISTRLHRHLLQVLPGWTLFTNLFCTSKSSSKNQPHVLDCFDTSYYGHHIPLTTTTRGNKATFPQLVDELEKILETSRKKRNDSKINVDNKKWDDSDSLTKLMRSSVEARRMASLAMSAVLKTSDKIDSLNESRQRLWKQVQCIWPKVLELPFREDQKEEYPFQISVVIPAYAEQGHRIQANLQRALSSSHNPYHIQVVIVDAGKNTAIERATEFEDGDRAWGDMQLVAFDRGGGRGPTLNFGAQYATGKIITFLHSDNILPDHWDKHITSTFECCQEKEEQAIACAFSFKINTSASSLDGDDYPSGLAAAQWLGTVRTKWFHGLYGDSVLSIPAVYFRYIGGYPEQALMEDYEIMDLLRKRVSSSPNGLSINDATSRKVETVCILPSETLVSPRRWQINGVPYVILFNCLCVFLYEQRGWSPEELYKFYYQRRFSSN